MDTLVVQRTPNLRILATMLGTLNIKCVVTGWIDTYMDEGALPLATDGVDFLVAWPAPVVEVVVYPPAPTPEEGKMYRVKGGYRRQKGRRVDTTYAG